MKLLISVNTTIKFMGLMILAFVVIWPLWYLFTYLDGKAMYNKIKNNPQVYVYDTFMGPLRQVRFIKSKSDAEALVKYYSLAEKKIHYEPIEFKLQYLSFEPMYLRSKEDLYGNSPIVEVIDIDTSSNTYEYRKCFVYRGTIHKNPPSDSMLKRFNEVWDRHNDSLNIPRMYFEP